MSTGGVANTPGAFDKSAIHIYENTSEPQDVIQSTLGVGPVVIHRDREVIQKAENTIEVDQYQIMGDDSRVNRGAQVTFMAGEEITLTDGFEANFNSNFRAFIGTSFVKPPNTHGRSAGNDKSEEVTSAESLTELEEDMVSVYPNPFTNQLTMRYRVLKPGGVSLKIFNATGQEVTTPLPNIPHIAGAYEINIDVSAFSTGIYYYVLQTPGKRFSGQVISQR